MPGHEARMPLIERYILRRTTRVFLITLAAMTATLWVTQVLRELDVVTAKGQAVWVFLLMTFLALPALVQVIAPIAFLAGTLATLSALTADSELPVIAAAGASRRAVDRPILVLGLLVMIAVAFSHHVLAPASLSSFRGLLTQVRADVIATLFRDGDFRALDNGLTMHIRAREPDGSFRGIFVSDERDPSESLQYSAERGLLLERTGSAFLVLQDGDLIREDRADGDTSIVAFETYALDLSRLAVPAGTLVFEAQERSTLYLLSPQPDDPMSGNPVRIRGEIHDRLAAPLYVPAFALLALAFLGRPRTSRQSRNLAIAMVVVLCVGFRAAGFAATALSRSQAAAIPFLYIVPVGAILLGIVAARRMKSAENPRFVEALGDRAAAAVQRMLRRAGGASPAGGGAA
jgi:lipopolysaccharide export system permease protein